MVIKLGKVITDAEYNYFKQSVKYSAYKYFISHYNVDKYSKIEKYLIKYKLINIPLIDYMKNLILNECKLMKDYDGKCYMCINNDTIAKLITYGNLEFQGDCTLIDAFKSAIGE